MKSFPDGVNDLNNAEYVAWKRSHPDELIVNHVRSPRTHKFTLHRQGCHMVSFKKTALKKERNPKECFDSEAELLGWMVEKKGSPGLPLKGCWKCRTHKLANRMNKRLLEEEQR